MTSQSSGAEHHERLGVPLRWWAVAVMFVASVLLAFLVATPLWLALGVAGALMTAVSVLFLGYGAARVDVRDGELRAGRAHIEVSLLGAPTPLGPADARRLAGMDADARAYLLLRPYVRTAVQVPVLDPGDPAPYWLVSTRRPDRLVAALDASQARGHRADG